MSNNSSARSVRRDGRAPLWRRCWRGETWIHPRTIRPRPRRKCRRRVHFPASIRGCARVLPGAIVCRPRRGVRLIQVVFSRPGAVRSSFLNDLVKGAVDRDLESSLPTRIFQAVGDVQHDPVPESRADQKPPGVRDRRSKEKRARSDRPDSLSARPTNRRRRRRERPLIASALFGELQVAIENGDGHGNKL